MMTNLKKPEEYAAECGVFKESKIAPMNLNLYRDAHVKSQRDIVKAIQQAQRDAYNQAIDDAVENVQLLEQSNWGKYENYDPDPNFVEKNCIKKNNYGHGDCNYQIITPSKQSILKLKI